MWLDCFPNLEETMLTLHPSSASFLSSVYESMSSSGLHRLFLSFFCFFFTFFFLNNFKMVARLTCGITSWLPCPMQGKLPWIHIHWNIPTFNRSLSFPVFIRRLLVFLLHPVFFFFFFLFVIFTSTHSKRLSQKIFRLRNVLSES